MHGTQPKLYTKCLIHFTFLHKWKNRQPKSRQEKNQSFLVMLRWWIIQMYCKADTMLVWTPSISALYTPPSKKKKTRPGCFSSFCQLLFLTESDTWSGPVCSPNTEPTPGLLYSTHPPVEADVLWPVAELSSWQVPLEIQDGSLAGRICD